MRNQYLLVASACFAIAIAGNANAQTYVGVSAGISVPHNVNNQGATTASGSAAADGGLPAGTPVGFKTSFDVGYNFAAQIGHRFDNGFRLEGEVAITRADVRRFSDLTVGSQGGTQPAGLTSGQVIGSGIGSQRGIAGFANAYYDVNTGTAFQPYLGGGIGIQETKFTYNPSATFSGVGKETNFAWQLMAGATYKLGPKFELFGQYNYRDGGKTTIPLKNVPANVEGRSRQSLVSVGFRIPLGK